MKLNILFFAVVLIASMSCSTIPRGSTCSELKAKLINDPHVGVVLGGWVEKEVPLLINNKD